ncbi:MAG: hypothetical protein ACREMX_15100, partial [Gemmatimonadales bacterium]
PPMTSGGVLLRGSSGRATIDYQPNVKRVKRDAGLAAIRGISKEGSTLLFDGTVPELRSLRPGDVLLIEGLLARKVLATDTVGGDIAVLAEQATLGETIRDGRIELSARVQFAGGSAQSSTVGAPWDRVATLLVSEAHAQSISELPDVAMDAVKGVFKGWETEFAAAPEKGRLNLSIHLTKNVGGFKAGITGEGYLADFELDTDIEVTHGVIDRLEMTHKQLNGLMNFRWEVSKDSPGAQTGDDRIKEQRGGERRGGLCRAGHQHRHEPHRHVGDRAVHPPRHAPDRQGRRLGAGVRATDRQSGYRDLQAPRRPDRPAEHPAVRAGGIGWSWRRRGIGGPG